MSRQWWDDYEKVTAIAGLSDLNQATPLFLDQSGQSSLLAQQVVIQYVTGAGKGLIITRFEGYATGLNTDPALTTGLPLYAPFPITAAAPLGEYPRFDWTNTDLLGNDPVVMMPSQPQAVFNCDCLLGAGSNRNVVLTMTNDPIAPTLYNFSVRVYAWLIPEAAVVNFQPLFTQFQV